MYVSIIKTHINHVSGGTQQNPFSKASPLKILILYFQDIIIISSNNSSISAVIIIIIIIIITIITIITCF